MAGMTILPPLNPDQHAVLKKMVAEIDSAEERLGQPFRDHEHEAFRWMDEQRAVMQAAVDGYEAVNPPD